MPALTIEETAPREAAFTGGFQVNIPDFAGPMDLLVFLVRRRELDVAYISVSAIAGDFLEWMNRADITDFDIVGDFILLAATLLQFKVANLLPGDEPELSEAEFAAIQRLGSPEDLAALRRTIAKLAELEARQINLFNRGTVELSGVDEELTQDMLSSVTAYDLALAFRDLIYRLPPEPTHIVEDIPYTLEGQMAYILSFGRGAKRVSFIRLAQGLTSRLAVVMTFLAMLELIRTGRLKVMQREPFGPMLLIFADKDDGQSL